MLERCVGVEHVGILLPVNGPVPFVTATPVAIPDSTQLVNEPVVVRGVNSW